MNDPMESIVTVDDVPENIRLLAGILGAAGYKVRPASNGSRALATIMKEPPDLILLDIMMPGMDGYEVCRQLKQDPLTKEIPVIFLSALDEAMDKVKAFQAGGVDYLTKPFHEKEVLARIDHQLTIRKQKNEITRAKELLNNILDASIDGIMAFRPVTDPAGRIRDFTLLVANPTAMAYFSCPRPGDNAHGTQPDRSVPLFSSCFPELFQSDMFHELVAVVQHGQVLNREFFYDTPACSAWLAITAVRLTDGFTATLRDITKEKALETNLKRQAHIDGLTGLSNRRYFDEFYALEFKRCLRENQPLTVIFIDVDYFKLYNDTYGHQKGDECLIRLGQAFKTCIKRPGDILARYGGEEFVAVLSGTDLSGGEHLAGTIQDHVHTLGIEHQNSKIKPFITVSMGLSSTIPTRGMKMEKLIETADRALYKAKQNGRNRYEVSLL